jgi:5-methylcytosine-specific restriction endonuclease McrA
MLGTISTAKQSKKMQRRAWDHKWNMSAKAKASARRYYYSEKGRAAKKAYRSTYKLTEEQRARYRATAKIKAKEAKRKEQIKRYWQSEKGRKRKAAKDLRYQRTPGGKWAKRKIEIKRKYQLRQATLTRAEWNEIKERHHHRCAYCSTAKPLEMDHVTPLSRGGQHTKTNVVPACRTCNARKGQSEAFGR